MKNKTCFVISPIGDKDSDIRKHADAFLKLLVEPSLGEFGFNIVRADQIASSSLITNDIVEYVQQSELCLVDLTFHNPNVFYECGRRHENGRPTIQLIKSGESLPFDVAGIRTIQYDLTDPWTTLESVNTIKEYVTELEHNDAYGEKTSGASLSTIAESLRRIEKKISATDSQYFKNIEGALERKDLLTMHPAVAFHKTMELGDINSAKFLLQRLKLLPDNRLYIEALAVLAGVGDNDVKNQLIDLVPKEVTSENENALMSILIGLKSYYYNTNSEKAGLEELKEVFPRLLPNEALSEDFRAFVFNLRQGLEYQIGNYESALKDALSAVELSPKDSSYWYNLSLNHHKLGHTEESADAVIKYVKYADGLEPYHINHAIEVMSLSGRESETQALLSGYVNVANKSN